MSQNQPKITIGITCYNAEDTIGRAIESALKQDYPNFEIVVVDDCSKDNSVSIIQNAAEKFANVRLVRHEINKGYPSALNSIIENASGDYVAFFDDDDDSDPQRLKKQLERITAYAQEKGTDSIFCYSNRLVVRSDPSKKNYSFKGIGHLPQEPSGAEVADYILWDTGAPGKTWGMFGSCTLMVSKDLLVKVGGFDPAFRRCAEWDIAIRAGFMNTYFISVNEPLVIQHKTPTTDKSGKIPLKYSMMLRDKHKDYLVRKGINGAARLMAVSRYYGGRGKKPMSNLYLAAACIAAPIKLFCQRIVPKLIAKLGKRG